MIKITPLEAWIRKKTGIGDGPMDTLFREVLEEYQLRKINETIDYARHTTPFYRRHLASLPERPLAALSDLSGIPFTKPWDISKNPASFLAVRQDDVARIVTLRTSGSTGESKRLFFTEEDLELTMDFFHHGMSALVRPGQKVMIFLPGELPDSVGDLLKRGLKRMDVESLVYGPIKDPVDAACEIVSFDAHCLVGIPTQILGVARSRAGIAIGKGRIETVLLSTDYVPQAIVHALKDIWGCRVFNHYGMTEMGLGGAVECEALEGYHLREGDLFFEVVDYETGEVCPDGVMGEVVFTTLTRRGMPLVRYRTGDIARIIPELCPCGTVLRRMECVRGRWSGVVCLGPGCMLSLPDMDEALFQLPDLLDYRVAVSKGRKGKFRLHIDVQRAEGGSSTDVDVLHVLNRVNAIQIGISGGHMEIPVVQFPEAGHRATTGVAKRKIIIVNE
jgi:phenylacetate-CoA ligase